MAQTPATKQVPTPAEIELSLLLTHMGMWRAGHVPAREIRIQLFRTYRKLTKACWCGEGVCCSAHGRHVDPHRDCLLKDR